MRLLILNFVFLLASCHSSNNKGVKNAGSFDLQGHRGCRGLMPENSIEAMLRAVDLGVTTLEMDVCITKDSVCILSHEPFFNHEISTGPDGRPVAETAEKQLNIFGMTFDQTQLYDVGSKPHPRFPEQQKFSAHKPKLAAVFDSVKRYCAERKLPVPFFNIETKTNPDGDNILHPAPEPFVKLLMAEVQAAGLEERVIIQSFDFRTLQVMHRLFPGVQTAALIEGYDLLPLHFQLEKLGFTPSIYSPAHELVTAELVAACHAKGIRIIPWTVNDPAVASRLKALGIDGLITDYPDRVK